MKMKAVNKKALLPMLAGERNVVARKRAVELLEALDVGHRAKAMPSQLSGGEQQRVAIARALVNHPPVILADEPTAPLDSQRALAVIGILNDMARHYETAIIIVTHDEKIIPSFKRIYHIRDGRTHEFDLSGGNRRQLESLAAKAGYQRYKLPSTLPLRVPSELVRLRPDIEVSEALMKAANADYGAAAAKSFPQITLGADIGSQTLSAASLFGSGSLVWGLAGQLVQPLFNKGIGAERDAAKAGFDAAAANYRQSVLKGLREVADVLTALDNNQKILSGYTGADAAAQEQLMITGNRYKLGSASYLELLQTQSESEQYRLELIASQARRLSDTVAFYPAMGGGRQ